MDIKAVLAVLGGIDEDRAGLHGAIALAQSHEAHLIGLHAVEMPVYPTYVNANVPAEVFEIQRQNALGDAEQVREQFEAICSSAGLSAEWRCMEGGGDAVISLHAHYADLVTLTGPDDTTRDGPSLVERVVMGVARPVLMVRPGCATSHVGDYVVIAWNGRRESARAVNDGMAVLQKAKQVSVVVVNTEQTRDSLGDMPGADLAHHLARHGVRAEAQRIDAEAHSVGDALLEWSKGQGADMLMMGAYGHSRFREVLLGGATRDVLANAQIPVLMSH